MKIVLSFLCGVGCSLLGAIDAGASPEQKLLADDGEPGDMFGCSLSLDGSTTVVGAFGDDDQGGDSGSAYVLVESGSSWIQQAKLLPGGGAAGDDFGRTVALSGDTAVVGARGDDDLGNNSGSAYVFVRSGTVWTEQAKLLAGDGTESDLFGTSVSVSGDTLVVGAPNAEHAGSEWGAAYVFVRSGTTWIQEAKLLPGAGVVDADFGDAVSICGDTVVVGAPEDDDNGVWSGSIYVFVRNGMSWTQEAKLLAADGAAGDWFGTSVSVSDDTVVAGAPADDDFGVSSGSAYVFERSGTIWAQQEKFQALAGAPFEDFGSSVSVKGDWALVGAKGTDDNGTNAGAAHLFGRSGSVWTRRATLHPSDGAVGDYFGVSVSVSGDRTVVGAYFDDDNGLNSGSAYVIDNPPPVWMEDAKLLASDGAADDRFGRSVSVSGDVAVVGAEYDDSAGNGAGSAYVFTRSGANWTQQVELMASDASDGDSLGCAASVDGDTVIAGAFLDDDFGVSSGSAYVFVRAGATWSEQAKLLPSDGEPHGFFGDAVSLSGDTVVVGARNTTDHGIGSGSAYVFVRNGMAWLEQAKLLPSDGEAYDGFGTSVAIEGDTVIVGSLFDNDLGSASGSAYVFVRAGAVWTEEAKLLASDGVSTDYFGRSVALSGETAIVGAADHFYLDNPGSAYVFVRSGGVWTQQAKLQAGDGSSSELFGASVSLSGNTAIVGDYFDGDQGLHSGSAYVFRRHGSTWSPLTKLLLNHGQANDYFGFAVDVCDGVLIVGADSDDDGAMNAGSAGVFLLPDQPAGEPFCFGDAGAGTPCPCGNDNDGSVPGSGCANGVFSSGARLVGTGDACVTHDTLVFSATGLEPANSGLYFQADNDLSPGLTWGDGLRCAGGQLKRLGVRISDAGGASDTSGFAQSISAKTGNIQAGDTKYYQCWYRNPLSSPCGQQFNATNGYAITWSP